MGAPDSGPWLRRWQAIAVVCLGLSAALAVTSSWLVTRVPEIVMTVVWFPAELGLLALGCSPHTDRCGPFVSLVLFIVVPTLVWPSLIVGVWLGGDSSVSRSCCLTSACSRRATRVAVRLVS